MLSSLQHLLAGGRASSAAFSLYKASVNFTVPPAQWGLQNPFAMPSAKALLMQHQGGTRATHASQMI